VGQPPQELPRDDNSMMRYLLYEGVRTVLSRRGKNLTYCGAVLHYLVWSEINQDLVGHSLGLHKQTQEYLGK
jgi:hypothetical protein